MSSDGDGVTSEGRGMTHLFPAVAECVEEAVVNSLCRAETMAGRDGNTRLALPVDEVTARTRERRAAQGHRC